MVKFISMGHEREPIDFDCQTLDRWQEADISAEHERAAEISFYCKFIGLVDKVSKRHRRPRKERRELATGLDKLYFALHQKDCSDLWMFLGEYGDKAGGIYDVYIRDLKESVENLRAKFLDNPREYGIIERLFKVSLRGVGWSVLRFELARLSQISKEKGDLRSISISPVSEREARLLNLAGISRKQMDQREKLAISMLMGGGLGVVYWAALVAGGGWGFTHPMFENLSTGTRYLILIPSYFFNYIPSTINSLQNWRLLKNERIGNCPNGITTGTEMALSNIFSPEKHGRLICAGTVFVTTITPAWKDVITLATAEISAGVSTAIFMSNLVTGGVNLIQAGGDEVVLRTFGRVKKNKNRDK